MRTPTPDALLSAIHSFCMECSGGSRKQVKTCNRTSCPLYPYRCRETAETQRQQGELRGQMDMNELLSGGGRGG